MAGPRAPVVQETASVTTPSPVADPPDETPAFTPRWSHLVKDIPDWVGRAPRAPITFAWGLPDTPSFPSQELTSATELVLREHSDRALQYGPARGAPPLIEALTAKLNHDENLGLTTDELLITNGASQALGLNTRTMIDPGDTVLVEAPTWPGALNMLRRAGAQLAGLPFDAQGPDLAAMESRLEALAAQGVHPKLFYTIPTFQNPTGLTLSAERRAALLDLAGRYDLLVVEDDAYRELSYDGPVPPSLQALDDEGRVIRIGTFSKTLGAGLRLGWALGRPELLHTLMTFKEDGGTSPFSSYVVAAYMVAGALGPHIADLVALYRQKRDIMLRAIEWYFPAEVTWTRPAGGFFVWVILPERLDAADLLARAREEGVDFLLGDGCFPEAGTADHTLRLAFSQPTTDQIEEGIKRLGDVLKTML